MTRTTTTNAQWHIFDWRSSPMCSLILMRRWRLILNTFKYMFVYLLWLLLLLLLLFCLSFVCLFTILCYFLFFLLKTKQKQNKNKTKKGLPTSCQDPQDPRRLWVRSQGLHTDTEPVAHWLHCTCWVTKDADLCSVRCASWLFHREKSVARSERYVDTYVDTFFCFYFVFSFFVLFFAFFLNCNLIRSFILYISLSFCFFYFFLSLFLLFLLFLFVSFCFFLFLFCFLKVHSKSRATVVHCYYSELNATLSWKTIKKWLQTRVYCFKLMKMT
jgi:hypothetical protein